MPKRRFQVEKLIRDKVPKILGNKNILVVNHIMDDQTYLQSLKNKLIEEAKEVACATNQEEIIEELGDLLEVIHTLCATLKIDQKDVEQTRLSKKERSGGFTGKVYNTYVEIDHDHEDVGYYANRPHDYPEIELN